MDELSRMEKTIGSSMTLILLDSIKYYQQISLFSEHFLAESALHDKHNSISLFRHLSIDMFGSFNSTSMNSTDDVFMHINDVLQKAVNVTRHWLTESRTNKSQLMSLGKVFACTFPFPNLFIELYNSKQNVAFSYDSLQTHY